MRGALTSTVPFMALLLLGFGVAWASPRLNALTPQVSGDAFSPAPGPPISVDASKLTETAAAFRPAPIPNPDMDAPHAAPDASPSLSPAFFSQKQLSDGDGFSNASSVDAGQEKRRQPAAGLNLSVPVK